MVCDFLAEEMAKATSEVFEKYQFPVNKRNKEALKRALSRVYKDSDMILFDLKFNELSACGDLKRCEELRNLTLYMIYEKQNKKLRDKQDKVLIPANSK